MPKKHPQVAAYGSWKSPITPEIITSNVIGLGKMCFDGSDLYWLESRPSEGGRQVLVKQSINGIHTDITPFSFNVRTRVHEYGGGEYVVHNGTVYFSHFSDQRIYRQPPGATPVPMSTEDKRFYADYLIDTQRGNLICVCEDHSNSKGLRML